MSLYLCNLAAIQNGLQRFVKGRIQLENGNAAAMVSIKFDIEWYKWEGNKQWIPQFNEEKFFIWKKKVTHLLTYRNRAEIVAIIVTIKVSTNISVCIYIFLFEYLCT